MNPLTAPEGEKVRGVIAKLDGLQGELTASVKRKAEAPVTLFQLRLINSVLAEANSILGDELPLAGFSQFDIDEIPTAADVAMVVSQYVETFEKIRCENIHNYDTNRWMWGDGSNTFTVGPGRK